MSDVRTSIQLIAQLNKTLELTQLAPFSAGGTVDRESFDAYKHANRCMLNAIVAVTQLLGKSSDRPSSPPPQNPQPLE